MKITCPKCGEIITLSSLGRKQLNIPLKNVCEALGAYPSTTEAARKLGCSEAYIFKQLKEAGLKLKDVRAKGVSKK